MSSSPYRRWTNSFAKSAVRRKSLRTVGPIGKRSLVPSSSLSSSSSSSLSSSLSSTDTRIFGNDCNYREAHFAVAITAHNKSLSPQRPFSSAGTAFFSSDASLSQKEPPQATAFRKVLIANRGEIAIRVARTCRRLGIPTVAVYASNDAGSKHTRETDEAVCLGTDGSASYTSLENLLNAVRTVRADAVHPGYGFLSENAEFASAIQTEGVTWLGPPASAIRDMGCKLRSKELAREAGVAIIPGCDSSGGEGGDGSLGSVEEALELLHNSRSGLKYPVLLKAAAGGGGKGMRICRNDQELIEGYPLAQSEGEKFFADGRLLLEQYLEEPHHIEFQVVCSKRKTSGDDSDGVIEVDVAIFAERECSIQRRNQKVVEESPSCLLKETTRRKMMEQTALLCQKVGYEGAGTVEWLVVDNNGNGGVDTNGVDNGDGDESQNFYFLEMNTRLQVEHPITEAVSKHKVDLVEAMLEVGSGKGLPSDWYDVAEVVEIASSSSSSSSAGGGKMLIMPFEGHSIEGRIYAEDPLKGYLPSTGPLLPYKEPQQARMVDDGSSSNSANVFDESDNNSSYLRLDSGVVEGHVVTPFYDPMLSKIISYAPTREEAIKVLSDGLDSYVIEGVKHNAKLVQAVLRHPSFRSGKTPTSFLEKEIPDFREYRYDDTDSKRSSSLLSASEEEELAAAIAVIARSREKLLGRPPVAGGGDAVVVVRPDGLFGDTDAFLVEIFGPVEGETTHIRVRRMGDSPSEEDRVISVESIDLDLQNYLARVTLDGTQKTIQVLSEKHSGEFKVQMHGAEYTDCLVQSLREYELSRHMLPPLVEDTSNVVMSPMPGTLIGYSKGVAEGVRVEEDQELCVVEAMKMQNIIRAPREGIISRVCVETGSALVTDQIILEFEEENDDEAASAA